MKKKRKNKSMYLLLMLLLLASAGFATYAIYKTSASGSANVTAANWVVKVTTNGSTVNVTGGNNNIDLGTCQTHLAPGGSCTIPFTVDMSEAEVDSIVSVEVGTGIAQETLDLMTAAGITLKISDGTNEGYSYVLQYGTTKPLNLVIDWEAGEETDDEKASADVAVSKIVGGLTIPVNMIVKQYNGGGESPALTYQTYTVGDVVYFNPIDGGDTNECTSATGNCMKFYVIETADDSTKSTISLQLDHNLVNSVAWISQEDYNDDTNYGGSGNINKGPITALTSLATQTSSWTNVDPLTYTYNTSASRYNYGTLSCTSGTCTIGSNIINNVKARMITADEVAAITTTQTDGTTDADSWSLSNQSTFYFSDEYTKLGTTYMGYGNKNLSWLIENTTENYNSGATKNAYGTNSSGYWTLSPVSWGGYNVFYVNYEGELSTDEARLIYYGARPVISVLKSKLQ